ncbi:MAG TPA: peroxiredoxin-like family protein [Candidatus Dormibacteraeota bacterium]|nr:peroxiredoxin-like family protein [Candidatus Dormibacteraeota bacterium]
MKDQAEALGNLVIVGQGSLEQGRDYDRTHGKGLAALVDSRRETYRVLGFTRGVASTLGPRSALASIRAASRGFVQSTTQGDAFQQGGTLVLAAGGRPVYFYRSQFAGDHTDVGTVLAKLAEAARRGEGPAPT